jgi:hypothetical protein
MIGILIIIIGHGDVYRRLIKWIKAKVKFETKAVGPKVALVLVSDSPCKMMQTMRRLCSKTKGEFLSRKMLAFHFMLLFLHFSHASRFAHSRQHVAIIFINL